MASNVKCATFNVNSVRARIPIIGKWLEREKPDVLCIQETKVVDDLFPVADFRALGYQAVFRGQKSYNGVAIVSRIDMDDPHYGFDGTGEDEGTRLISVTIGGIHIVNTYVPQGTAPDSDRFQYKLAWFDRILDHFNRNYSIQDRLIWMGDFNVAPDPIDVHDPKRLLGHVGFHPDEHKALARVKEWGFIDIFRKHKPDPGQYTFWDYRARDAVKRGIGWRVDHIWATPPMAEASVDTWIDIEPRTWEKPSDHTPLVAVFQV